MLGRVAGAAARAGLAATGIVFGEAAYAVLLPVPDLEEFDPSVTIDGPGPDRLRIGVLGDSSCTGPGVDGPDDIWVRMTARDLADHGFSVEVTSYAVGGSTVSDLLADQLAPIRALAPDIALVSIGGNDVLKGVPLRTFERQLTELAEALVEVSDLVVLSGVGDVGTIPRLLPPLRNLLRNRARRFDLAHARVADAVGAVKADQWSVAPGVFADPATFSIDRFHPGPLGHRHWADIATDALVPHLDSFRGR